MNPLETANDAFRLRAAEPSDVYQVFAWRNDPWIVSLSSSGRPVTWAEHQAWFSGALDQLRHLLFIVELNGGISAGTVRLDRQATEEAVATVYLLRPFTGKGVGPRAIDVACREAAARWSGLARVFAYVREGNAPSLKAFQRAGFVLSTKDAQAPAGHACLVREPPSGAARTWQDDDRDNVHRYSELIKAHGVSYRALDWGSAQGQRLRFEVLASVGTLDGCQVLDVGCGQADFLAWLVARGIDVKYTGLDITPGMVEIARRRFPEDSFVIGNFLAQPEEPHYDYVVASGLFSLRRADPEGFLRATVQAMFARCRRGMAFNSLSAWAPEKVPDEFYADPAEVLRWCRTLTPCVSLRHDYHPRDFTVYLYPRGSRT